MARCIPHKAAILCLVLRTFKGLFKQFERSHSALRELHVESCFLGVQPPRAAGSPTSEPWAGLTCSSRVAWAQGSLSLGNVPFHLHAGASSPLQDCRVAATARSPSLMGSARRTHCRGSRSLNKGYAVPPGRSLVPTQSGASTATWPCVPWHTAGVCVYFRGAGFLFHPICFFSVVEWT